ncbi:MAG TPA: hypothetical protein VFE38_16390 [Edaphobacter sp.]|nr:hypothetical protein [Edaphobacter sp.]
MRFSRQRNWFAVALPLTVASGFIFLLSGCASPGPARPPSLQLPQAVTDLSAEREGDHVLLRWTTPEKTTDGLKVQPPLTAEICSEFHASACTTVMRLGVRPGASEVTLSLPQNQASGPAALLAYRIQILNKNGRSAGQSAPAFSIAGAAPPVVESLRGAAAREGAVLEWKPQPGRATVELERTLVQAQQPTAKKANAKKPLQLTPTAPVKVRLQAGGTTDSGGTFDPTAQRGETYRYTAQRVRVVTLDGHTLRLRSAPSIAITVVMRDTFPPKAPTGLAAVPGDHAIDLSWDPNTEPDLTGYLVYRQHVSANGTDVGPRTQLTPAPVPAPAFSDRTAQVGETYSYRVVAVDAAGNQSSASAEVQELLK